MGSCICCVSSCLHVWCTPDEAHACRRRCRDVKSTNVLIDSEWRAKLCDFSFGVHQTCEARDNFVYGTTEFMAPEIAMSEDFSVAAGEYVN